MNLSLHTSTSSELLDNSPGSSVFDLPPSHDSGAVGWLERRQDHEIPSTSPLQQQGSKGSSEPSFLVISGGTGGNAICSAFKNACYVLPVSDDGGSSSEIIRVLGGPSIGDIRSRLIRLIPPAPSSSPLDAIRRLLAFRLPADCSEREARDLWRDIVEGRSPLWIGIPNDRKETIRGFLVYFESELLKRAHKNFDFRNGSVGNYFLAAAQGFFRSLPSAIFLFSSITNSQATILPVLVTNHTVTIAAELENGERLVGQCEISHPVSQTTFDVVPKINIDPWSPVDGMGEVISQRQNVMYESKSKSEEAQALPSKIHRLFYINAYGIEIHPTPNPDYLTQLGTNDVLIYSCGSLWTSIVPCLALRGVASAIARSKSLRAKILLLNSKNDRETSGYKAVDYIHAVVRTLNYAYQTQSYGLGNVATTYPITDFITDLVYLNGTSIEVDVGLITTLGVRCTMLTLPDESQAKAIEYDADGVMKAINIILGASM